MLAEHPNIFARVQKETFETLGPIGKVSLEDLRGMKYLRAVLNGKRFTRVRRSFILICRRDTKVVSKRVRVSVLSSFHIQVEEYNPWNVRCFKKGAVWPGPANEGKPLYIPGGTLIHYLSWLMHRRKDLWLMVKFCSN